MAKANGKLSASGKRSSPRLAALDMKLQLDEKTYLDRLGRVQERLRLAQQAYLKSGHSAAIVFEGWDAAGKGGTIRCMSSVLDPRSFKVWPISAPRQYYLERHYLARFFERLPPSGAIAVFDRSWYGRVLVERVEGLASRKDWRRAYHEINEFEHSLTDHGTRVIKIFLHITQDEQLERFRRRLLDPTKRWKLSYDDFRNRKKWDAYEEATEDMFRETSTSSSPWYAIPANSKKYARVEALRIIARRLCSGVDLAPAELDEALTMEARELLKIDAQSISHGGPRFVPGKAKDPSRR
jgi:AMP-polyphosphate phosphotransferase